MMGDMEHSLACRPLVDEVLRFVFGESSRVKRYEAGGYLDTELDLDGYVRLDNGALLSFQEKTLRARHADRNTITHERYNNRPGARLGAWHKSAAMIYMIGYVDNDEQPTRLERWAVIDMSRLKIAHNRRRIDFGLLTNSTHGRADAYYVEANDLYAACPECWIAQSGMLDSAAAEELARANLAEDEDDES